MNFGIKSETLSKKNLTVNLYKVKNINTNFHNNNIPKDGSQCIYLSVILIDSVSRKDKNYHFQVFLEECNYVFFKK